MLYHKHNKQEPVFEVNCPVCQRETSPIKIGGQLYCSVCGTPAAENTQAPKRLSLDLSPRSRTNIQATPKPTKKTQAPVGASALHGRAKNGQVLDLRGARARTDATPKVAAAPHHDPAAPPHTTAHERHLAHFSDRIEKAKQISRSPHIDKFSGSRLPDEHLDEPAAAHSAPHTDEPLAELPKLTATHHEAMTRLVPTPPPLTPTPSPLGTPGRVHLKLSPHHSRIATTIAAVVIMGGYIWLQNYPKFALQGADNRAGVAASLPGYLPSSYSLSRTTASPGLVTLNFSSPSASSPLKIDQHRTTWDSSSLLDNYVAKNTDDYSTVQGQGLTIYMFNNNHATWVNKGIWFSIEGADHLSQQQILKLIYSL